MSSYGFSDNFIDKHPNYLNVLDIIIRYSTKCLQQIKNSEDFSYEKYESCMLKLLGVIDSDEKSEIIILPENLQRVFIRERQPGDGNCLFHSFADGINRLQDTDYTHSDIRALLCRYLEEHIEELREYGVTDEYIATMKRDGTWGDGVAIATFTSYF